MLKRSLKLGLVALALGSFTPSIISAEPNKEQKGLEASYNYRGSFAVFSVFANLKVNIDRERYSSNLNVLKSGEKKPTYSLSVSGKVRNDILYPETFIFFRDLNLLGVYVKKDTYTLKFSDNNCVEIFRDNHLENKRESNKKCSEKRAVDYLTAFLQVMWNLRNNKDIPKISVISQRGRISERDVKIRNRERGSELSIPLGKKFFKTLEAKLDKNHEPTKINLLGNIDLRLSR